MGTYGVEDGEIVVKTDDLEVVGAVVADHEVTRGDPGETTRERRVGVAPGPLVELRQGDAKTPGVSDREELVGGQSRLKALDMLAAGGEQRRPGTDRLVGEAGIKVAGAAWQSKVTRTRERGRRTRRGHENTTMPQARGRRILRMQRGVRAFSPVRVGEEKLARIEGGGRC